MANEFVRKNTNIEDIKKYQTKYDDEGDLLLPDSNSLYYIDNNKEKIQLAKQQDLVAEVNARKASNVATINSKAGAPVTNGQGTNFEIHANTKSIITTPAVDVKDGTIDINLPNYVQTINGQKAGINGAMTLETNGIGIVLEYVTIDKVDSVDNKHFNLRLNGCKPNTSYRLWIIDLFNRVEDMAYTKNYDGTQNTTSAGLYEKADGLTTPLISINGIVSPMIILYLNDKIVYSGNFTIAPLLKVAE